MSREPRTSIGSCPRCGKTSFRSRKAARAAARSFHPGEHKRIYRCVDERWHYGRLDSAVPINEDGIVLVADPRAVAATTRIAAAARQAKKIRQETP